jgi:endo-1,4-beta-xylanase
MAYLFTRYLNKGNRLAVPLLKAFALFSIFLPAAAQSLPTQPAKSLPNSHLDQAIRALRTGDLQIQVIGADRKPIANATIQIQQTAHAFRFGTSLRTQMFAPSANVADQSRYLALAKRLFNASVHEDALKWYSTEPERGKVSYADADRILTWSQQNNLKMRGHTLFWEVEKWNQPWLKRLSAKDLRLAVQQRTTEICSRYRGQIDEFDVLNETLHGNFFRGRLGADIVKSIFLWCKAANPNVRLYVNDYNILNGRSLAAYGQEIQALIKQGVPISGIGIQAHILEKTTPQQIQHSLDTLARFKLPLTITEVSVVAPSELEQQETLSNLYRIAFAHPAVDGIFLWGFWEGSHWIPEAALFRRNFAPKLAAIAYQDLLYRQWWTQVNQSTSRDGTVTTRAFFGQYQVSVRYHHQLVKQTFTFRPSHHQSMTIKIELKN